MFNVFYGDDMTNLPEIIERKIIWPTPVFTNKFRIMVLDSAELINLNMEILGQRTEDRYDSNPNMDYIETYDSMSLSYIVKLFLILYFCLGVPANLLQDITNTGGPNSYQLNRHLCPYGKLEFSGILRPPSSCQNTSSVTGSK